MTTSNNSIAIYSRKSKYTGKGDSIYNQIELCKDYIQTHYGVSALKRTVVYEDEGFSGGNLNRPDFKKMMLAAESHCFQTIIVYRLDRISRNISDFSNLIEILSRLHIDFISIKEQFDTSTPTGRAMMYISSIFSQLERETIAERIRDNMHELAKTGRWLGGTTPTGYTSETIHHTTPDGKTRHICHLKLLPHEAEIVRTIYHLYLQYDSLTQTEATLIKQDIRTKNKKYFTRFSIKAILQNPVYAIADLDMYLYFLSARTNLFSDKVEFDGIHGILAYNRTIQKKGKTTVFCSMKDWIVSVGQHTGLIPGYLWIKVQESLERNKKKSYRKPRKNNALLTGLLFCTCGNHMYPKLNSRKVSDESFAYSYFCQMKERSKGTLCNQKNINGNLADLAVFHQFKKLSYNKSSFLRYIKNNQTFYLKKNKNYTEQLQLLKSRQYLLKRKIDDYVDSLVFFEQTTIKPHIIRRIEECNKEYEQISIELQKTEQLTYEFSSTQKFIHTTKQICSSFSLLLDAMTVEEKRDVIRSITQKIIWDGRKLHVFLLGEDSK